MRGAPIVKPSFLQRLSTAQGIRYNTLLSRLGRGWDLERALYEPSNKKYYRGAKSNYIEREEPFNPVPIIEKERKDLNMQRVEEFFNPTIGTGQDFDDNDNDSDARFNDLQRIARKVYKLKNTNG